MSGDIRYGAPLRIHEVKASGDGAWEVSGHASTFGNVDLGNDVIHKGAFTESLSAGGPVRFLYSHDPSQVLGTALSLQEDEKGLHGRWRISKTRLGEDVHTLLKDGALDSFSIGYIPRDFEVDEDTGTRHLKSVELLEVSVVAMPMNPLAMVTAVKAEPQGEGKAEWTAAFINDLPDSAFAVVLGGGEKDGDGRTTPRSLRKLPHHGTGGGVDMAHLRNALSREPQTDMPSEAHRRAKAHLQRHARAEGIGTEGAALPIELVLDIASLEGEEALRLVNALWERRREEGQRPSDRLVALVDGYRKARQAEADALLSLLTAPTVKEEARVTPEPSAPPPPAEVNASGRVSQVERYLRLARLRDLRRTYGLSPLAGTVPPEG